MLVPQPQRLLRTPCGLAENPDETARQATTLTLPELDRTSRSSYGRRHDSVLDAIQVVGDRCDGIVGGTMDGDIPLTSCGPMPSVEEVTLP